MMTKADELLEALSSDEVKLAKKIFAKFPPDSKHKRGGKLTVLLTGNTADVLNMNQHSSVNLLELPSNQLLKLEQLLLKR